MTGPWDAWFSQKMLNAIEYYNIYADAEGNQYLCTTVGKVGSGHGCSWDDMVYLGTMVKRVRHINNDMFRSFSIPANVRTAPLIAIVNSVPVSVVNSAKAVNDYTCPACHNNKCSKTEKSCWKCGFHFSNG